MRVPLPQLRANGHSPRPAQVYTLSGICEQPLFRMPAIGPNDLCVVYLGASGLVNPPGGDDDAENDEPYLVLRRWFADGQVAVILRVALDGVFVLYANDDELAERVFQEVVVPARPEEVDRQWRDEPAALESFGQLLIMR